MKYTIDVVTPDLLKETISGEDINEVLNRLTEIQLETKGYRIGDIVLPITDKKEIKAIKKENAKIATDNIKQLIEKETDLLKKSLLLPINISWSYLLSDFYNKNPEPVNPDHPQKPDKAGVPLPPQKTNLNYIPQFKIMDKLISSRKDSIIEQTEKSFENDYKIWEMKKLQVEQENKVIEEKYNQEINRITEAHNKAYQDWESKRELILKNQIELEASYKNYESYGIEKYCEIVLMSSKYETSLFEKYFYLKYFSENKTLFVEYNLPAKKDLTCVKEIKYVIANDEFQEINISDSELNRKYDNLLYEITLRTVYELFRADKINTIDQIIFNGVVNTIDPSTGNRIKPCLISISVSKKVFLVLNLSEIDPKECFRGLKGVSATKLHSLTPIQPIMQMNRDDKRFVEGYSVTSEISNETNLAAMDWEDFEHLIREIFEKEFSQNGGEVKVTQASRDGGVDAVAFDPDPIRGGKIVIQAKRYTNIVGVAAVRDLYGTVMNEGATKGILVTTSNYGSDAYEFAKGKPLTLLNGSNLLHLLEKHGHKAKIDIMEAKKILNDAKAN